jgi:hypothetical protein
MRDRARDEARASRDFSGIERRVLSSEVLFAASNMGTRLSRDVSVTGDIGRRILSSDVLFVERLWTLLLSD